MIRPRKSSRRHIVGSPASRRAFTLIELLTVMAIMLVLAGLILSVAGHANYKASLSRANAEIQQISTVMESYKVDNGAYPRNGDTDALNAQTSTDPSAYIASSQLLFQQLSGITSTPPTKTYINFLPGQLMNSDGTAVSAGMSTKTYIIDPFGFSYGYSTANQKAQDTANSATPPGTVDNTKGFNPTFDLWSTAGYASNGKSLPAGITTATANTLWVKNW